MDRPIRIDKWIEQEEPDGEWYGQEDGVLCNGTPKHYIADRDDIDIVFHNGLPYCIDCLTNMGIYPSEGSYWEPENREFWTVEDEDSYYGDEKL
jgi:hypothetical protein